MDKKELVKMLVSARIIITPYYKKLKALISYINIKSLVIYIDGLGDNQKYVTIMALALLSIGLPLILIVYAIIHMGMWGLVGTLILITIVASYIATELDKLGK